MDAKEERESLIGLLSWMGDKYDLDDWLTADGSDLGYDALVDQYLRDRFKLEGVKPK